MKDTVAHLAAWERHATERLHALARGEDPEPVPPLDMTRQEYEYAFNENVYQTWRNRPWNEVRGEAESAYSQFLAAAKALPDALLFRPEKPAWRIVAFNGYLHYRDFIDHIDAWLKKPVPET